MTIVGSNPNIHLQKLSEGESNKASGVEGRKSK